MIIEQFRHMFRCFGLTVEFSHVGDQFGQHFAGQFDVSLIFLGVHFGFVVDVEVFEEHTSRHHVDAVIVGDGGVVGLDGEFVDGDVQFDVHDSYLSFGQVVVM